VRECCGHLAGHRQKYGLSKYWYREFSPVVLIDCHSDTPRVCLKFKTLVALGKVCCSSNLKPWGLVSCSIRRLGQYEGRGVGLNPRAHHHASTVSINRIVDIGDIAWKFDGMTQVDQSSCTPRININCYKNKLNSRSSPNILPPGVSKLIL